MIVLLIHCSYMIDESGRAFQVPHNLISKMGYIIIKYENGSAEELNKKINPYFDQYNIRGIAVYCSDVSADFAKYFVDLLESGDPKVKGCCVSINLPTATASGALVVPVKYDYPTRFTLVDPNLTLNKRGETSKVKMLSSLLDAVVNSLQKNIAIEGVEIVDVRSTNANANNNSNSGGPLRRGRGRGRRGRGSRRGGNGYNFGYENNSR